MKVFIADAVASPVETRVGGSPERIDGVFKAAHCVVESVCVVCRTPGVFL